MNISEANATNTVLRALISGRITDEDIDAAAMLADRSRKALNAGADGREVRHLLTVAQAITPQPCAARRGSGHCLLGAGHGGRHDWSEPIPGAELPVSV